MPIDITSVSVTFGFGVKREEFGPVKKAEATIHAAVETGQDGAMVLNVAAKIARDKVGELLGLPVGKAEVVAVQTEQTVDEPDQGRGQDLPPAGDTGEPAAPGRKRRRTNAEIAADNAAAATAKDPASAQPAEVAPPASEPGTETEAGSKATGGATASAPAGGDEWDTPASAATITDETILSATSATSARLGKREPILDLKETYRNLELFPADQKFGITDIPQEHRADYLTKLAALKV
jgi:hypothetical protein